MAWVWKVQPVSVPTKPVPVRVQVQHRTRNTVVSTKHRGYTVNPYGYVIFFFIWACPGLFFCFFLLFLICISVIFYCYNYSTVVTLCSIIKYNHPCTREAAWGQCMCETV